MINYIHARKKKNAYAYVTVYLSVHEWILPSSPHVEKIDKVC
jgi:hypothetical protein